jgi:hydrogenase maturation factor HypF (carbamoyltransferase family)
MSDDKEQYEPKPFDDVVRQLLNTPPQVKLNINTEALVAKSACPKCDSTSFEMQNATIKNDRFNHQFIQCAKCGAVVGVLEHDNTGQQLQQLHKKVDSLITKLN